MWGVGATWRRAPWSVAAKRCLRHDNPLLLCRAGGGGALPAVGCAPSQDGSSNMRGKDVELKQFVYKGDLVLVRYVFEKKNDCAENKFGLEDDPRYEKERKIKLILKETIKVT